MSETFTFKGKQIKQESLKRVWEQTRRELSKRYAVEDAQMPKIDGVILSGKCFWRALKRVKQSSHMIDTEAIEWGESASFISACTFFADTRETWIVLVCEGLRPLEQELKHELLHIWENILGLQWGALTKKLV